MTEEALMDVVVGSKVATAAASEVAKGATTALVKGFIEKVVTPYFSGKKAKIKMVNGARKYARNLEFRTRCVPTIAIQGGAFVLDDVYEPLQLVRIGGEQLYRIEGYPSRLFNENRSVAIVDAAGMGKSTLTKYVIRRCLSELKKIPLLIELRRLKQGQTIIQFVCEELLGRDRSDAAVDDLISSLMEGNYLFLLDGYDEVDPELRADVSAEICRISADFQYCNFWLTSRPDPALSSFSEFSAFEIASLSVEQACSLLRRYDKGRGLAPALIEKLDALPQVEDFLGNPLLVTLLYKAFDYKATIPIKRNIFFRQVFDALYQDHDLSKEGAFERRKKSALDIDDFHRFARALGFFTFKAGKVQYSQVEFTSLIKEAIEKSQLSADAAKLRADLLSAVPIFVRDGNEVRWSHKAFQDYFASQFIYYDSASVRDDLIDRLFFSESIGRYENILCLLGELDLGLLRERCILPFVERLGLFELSDSGDVSVATRYLDSAVDVYALREFNFKRKQDGSSFFRPAVDELRKSYPDLELTAGIRMTYSAREALAVISFERADLLRYKIAGKIDVASFPWGRGKAFHLSGIKALVTNQATSLNAIMRESSDVERARSVAEVIAHMVDITVPTVDSLENLKVDVNRRSNARAAESLLDGL